jgi:hypothetical protein
MNKRIQSLRERLRDPLLTALTVLIIFLMFVVAPLQAMGAFVFADFGFVFVVVPAPVT